MKTTWVLAGLLTLQSSAVLAAGSISNLPSSGAVSLTGTVDRIADRDTLILRDAGGNTIDVHTNGAVTATIGQKVQVNGQLQSEMLGYGREIINARVMPIANDNRAVGGPFEPLNENNSRY